MATQASALEYASYGAGTAGYYETSPRKAAPAIPAERPAAIPERRAAVRTAVRTRSAYGISLLAIFGGAFAAALFLFIVLAQINYIEVTNGTVQLEERLNALTKEGKRLEIAYEKAFNMDAIEEYAINVLGMVKPETTHAVTVDAVPRDRAVILATTDSVENDGGLGSFLSSLLSYLR